MDDERACRTNERGREEGRTLGELPFLATPSRADRNEALILVVALKTKASVTRYGSYEKQK